MATDKDSICRKCRKVDWESLPALAENLEQGTARMIRTLKTNHKKLATSSCKTCRIFSACFPESPEKEEFVIQARPLSHSDFLTYSVPDQSTIAGKITALQVYSRSGIRSTNRCLVAIRQDGTELSSRMIAPRSIDYDLLKSLIQSCERDHQGPGRCRISSPSQVSVSGLKIIEVSSRAVIEAPSKCRYVALSYVWGKQPNVTAASPLQHLPRLIEDAISVTIALGYEYLWVDRYCIPQNNDRERHRMINQMDQVYSNASLTIIDASGGDAYSGLPGVSNLARRPQRCVQIRNTAILELPCGVGELNSSKWVTRGWTYQEGFFSRRRLVFTATQVIFFCNAIYAEESVYRLLRENDLRVALKGRFMHLVPDDRDAPPGYYLMPRLAQYSERELTYESDSLNAFLGVLNFQNRILSKMEHTRPMQHIAWGLVVQMLKGCLTVYLDWYHHPCTSVTRRSEFPSWSWAGWGGRLQPQIGIRLAKRGDYSGPFSHLGWEISLKSESQKAVDILDLANETLGTAYTDSLQRYQQPTYLKQLPITCLVVPVRIQETRLKRTQRGQDTEVYFEADSVEIRFQRIDAVKEITAVVPFSKELHIAAPMCLDQSVTMQENVIGLLFAREEKDGWMNFRCLLARPLNKDLYERVGAIRSLMNFPGDEPRYRFAFSPRLVFLDKAGSVLDKVRISARQKELPFEGVGERRRIVLV